MLGQCDITYKFAGTNDTSFFVEKVKHLSSCSSEMFVTSSVKGIPYTFIGVSQDEHKITEAFVLQ